MTGIDANWCLVEKEARHTDIEDRFLVLIAVEVGIRQRCLCRAPHNPAVFSQSPGIG